VSGRALTNKEIGEVYAYTPILSTDKNFSDLPTSYRDTLLMTFEGYSKQDLLFLLRNIGKRELSIASFITGSERYCFVLAGSIGCGKSALLRYLTSSILKHLQNGPRIPIPIVCDFLGEEKIPIILQ
jgi:hypothetical protein